MNGTLYKIFRLTLIVLLILLASVNVANTEGVCDAPDEIALQSWRRAYWKVTRIVGHDLSDDAFAGLNRALKSTDSENVIKAAENIKGLPKYVGGGKQGIEPFLENISKLGPNTKGLDKVLNCTGGGKFQAQGALTQIKYAAKKLPGEDVRFEVSVNSEYGKTILDIIHGDDLIELKNINWWRFKNSSIEEIKLAFKGKALEQARKQYDYCIQNGLRYQYVFEQLVPPELKDKVTEAILDVFSEFSENINIRYGVIY